MTLVDSQFYESMFQIDVAATRSGLTLLRRQKFRFMDFPGYIHETTSQGTSVDFSGKTLTSHIYGRIC